MKYSLTFVAYHPETSFYDRLEAVLAAEVDCWIFDNTPGGDRRLQELGSKSSLKYIHQSNVNIGLGPAMHQLLQQAWQGGVKAAVYFDQDTIFSLKSLEFINEWVESHHRRNLAAIHFQGAELSASGAINEEAKLFFNTACWFDLDKLHHIGWHDASFFVEGVDYKFCLDARSAGYALGIVGGAPDIDHDSLQPTERARIFGKEWVMRLYPPWRLRGFTWALTRLIWYSIGRKRFDYAYIFARNMATFWITQVFYRIVKGITRRPPPSKPLLEAGMLTYSSVGTFSDVWTNFTQGISSCAWVVNNAIEGKNGAEIGGNNAAFEFSGYLVVAREFKGEGPFLIVNDTLFKNHQTPLWKALVERVLVTANWNEDAVWGDIRNDGNTLTERPNPFLASWIFIIPNRKVLAVFTDALETMIKAPMPTFSEPYEQFLTAWLRKRPLGGWHGTRNEAAMERKRLAIKYEHTLSKKLLAAGIELRSMGEKSPFRYWVTRLADRVSTRLLSMRKQHA